MQQMRPCASLFPLGSQEVSLGWSRYLMQEYPLPYSALLTQRRIPGIYDAPFDLGFQEEY